MKKKRADPFYTGKAWRRLRAVALERDRYLCVMCMNEYRRNGRCRPRPATMVHHIVPREERPDLELSLDNLMSLCDEHHAQLHPEKGWTGRSRKEPSGGKGLLIYKL